MQIKKLTDSLDSTRQLTEKMQQDYQQIYEVTGNMKADLGKKFEKLESIVHDRMDGYRDTLDANSLQISIHESDIHKQRGQIYALSEKCERVLKKQNEMATTQREMIFFV